MAEIHLERVSGSFLICTACLDGSGGECHTPFCVMYLCNAPDVAVRDTLIFHGCTIEEVTIEESDPPACGIPLVEHVTLAAGFTWRDHAPTGCGCEHPSGEGATWTSERHQAPDPVSQGPEREEPRVSSRWEGKTLVWTINGEDVTDGELRAWCHINMPYPWNHVDVIRMNQVKAFAGRERACRLHGASCEATCWGRNPAPSPASTPEPGTMFGSCPGRPGHTAHPYEGGYHAVLSRDCRACRTPEPEKGGRS